MIWLLIFSVLVNLALAACIGMAIVGVIDNEAAIRSLNRRIKELEKHLEDT